MFKLSRVLQKVIIAKLFELGVVAGIVSMFYTVVADRLEYAMAATETSELHWTLAAMRTTLRYRVGIAELNQQYGDLEGLDGINPVSLLDRPPPGYAGEFNHPDPKRFRGGTWYFDNYDKCLVYLLNDGKYFSGSSSKMLKFKVELSRISTPAAGAGRNGRAFGALLVQVETK